MNKFKQSYLSLCLALLLCVGFLLTNSLNVYAYETEDNFYPIDVYADFQFKDKEGTFLYRDQLNVSEDGKYHLNNTALIGVHTLSFLPYTEQNEWTFPYNSDIYDYYLIGTLTAECHNDDDSTWKPTTILPGYRSVDSEKDYHYNISNKVIYNIDGIYYKGFGFYLKVDFQSANNTAIRHIIFDDDIHDIGDKPANLVMELGIMAVNKSSSEEVVLSQILTQLEKMESSIVSSIESAADSVTNAIENQYEMSDSEHFGVGEIQSQVDEKLGVLNFGADTLNNFLGLFSAENAGNTTITFPAFAMNIQGTSYQVWNDIEFDLSFLEENFGVLISAVRTVTVLCVWLAVLGYLVKAKDQLINNRG